MTAQGSATPNMPVICAGVPDAIAKCGQGSMLALEAAAYINADQFGEIWLLPLQDAGGSVAATGSLGFAGPTTAAGVLSLYIGGCSPVTGLPAKVSVALASGLTAAQLAAAVATAINAAPNMPVTAAVDAQTASQVDLTARNKGSAAADIDIRLNYLGTAGGEATPAGLIVTITAMAGGATNPVLTPALANLGEQPFDFICNPYTDATSIAAVTALLADKTGRWSWQAQLFGHAFGALRATYGAATTFGVTLNDPHATVMPFYDSPSPSFVWAAAITGAVAASIRADPALPWNSEVQIPGVLAPPIASRFTLPLRNTLLFDGMSTFTVDATGAVYIADLITTYQLNAQGQADASYLQVGTMFTLMAYLRARQAFITTTYARFKAVADGTRIPPQSNFITPSLFRAGLIAHYQTLCPELVQDPTDYAAGLVVTQNAQNAGRFDIADDPILTGGLRIFAFLVQFQLQAPASAAA